MRKKILSLLLVTSFLFSIGSANVNAKEANGKAVTKVSEKNEKEKKSGWKSDKRGSWYEYSDGSYPKDKWAKINGKWYYFNKYGYRSESKWIGNYYVGKDGVMLTNTMTPDGYRVDKNGKWVTASWKSYKNLWWYEYSDGYYLKNEWKKIDGTWYYFNSTGYMVTGWKEIGKDWFYFERSGAMVENKWIGNYYLGNGGYMLKNTVTPDGYKVDETGKWIREYGWKSDKRGSWYEYSDGSYPKDKWAKINGKWYYFNKYGYRSESKWIGDYYVGKDGVMLTDTKTPDGYKVDETGKWIQEWDVEAPAGRVIKGNKNSGIYHLPGQKDYYRINPKNIVWFATEKEAQANGYRRAKR